MSKISTFQIDTWNSRKYVVGSNTHDRTMLFLNRESVCVCLCERYTV